MNNDTREANLGISSGEKGCGKTYLTLKTQVINALTGGRGKYPRSKVLFLDTNNEYGDVKNEHNKDFPHIKTIEVTDLVKWLKSPIIDARRISVIKSKKEGGGKRNNTELQNLLEEILRVMRNGLLVIEDMTKFVSDSLPSDLIGSIISQRHVACDVIIHFQTIQKVAHPKLWANLNWFRMHKTGDGIRKFRDKLTGDINALYIGEQLIEMHREKGDDRFCVYYHRNTKASLVNKITGDFNTEDFREAVIRFLQLSWNKKMVKDHVEKTDFWTNEPVYKNRKEALEELIKYYVDNYNGNAALNQK